MTAAPARAATLIAALAACAAAVALPACGGKAEAPETRLAIARTAGPAQLDPALAADPVDLEAVWLVHTPLLTLRHAAGARGTQPIPGLAAELPEVSADGRVWRLRLREGLEYSDGSAVRAGDFERAIERLRALESPGARLYAGIAAIDTDDDEGLIEITLAEPDPEFERALALPFAAPVPERTPDRPLSRDPPPGVGPYQVGETTADGGFVLELNPDFDIPGVPAGSVDAIATRVIPDVARQAQAVLDGRLDYMHDPPPARLVPAIREQAGERYSVRPLPQTVLVEFERSRLPLNNPSVRDAFDRALDRDSLARRFRIPVVAGCALLAPGVPGYDEALDTDGCPEGPPDAAPRLETARELVATAGARGSRLGVAASSGVPRGVVRAIVRQLRRIGLDAAPAPVAEAGAVVRVLAPAWPSPSRFFAALEPLDPFVESELARLADDPEPDAQAWARLDTHVVSPPQSYVAPIGHPAATTFFSERMETAGAVLHPVFGDDYSRWRLKEGE